MKINTYITSVFLLAFGFLFSQEKGIIGSENWLNNWTEFSPSKIQYNTPTQILSGNISQDITLKKKDTYLLLGDVFITDSTTITIEPGTIILGDFKTKGSLIVTQGSKIMAQGTSTDPIIFTSSKSIKKPGDWGGIFILGDAPTNKFNGQSSLSRGFYTATPAYLNYGGEEVDSNSGVLSYVRIEFAGKRTKKYGFFSGLTLAGVGQSTIIDNIMVSYCEGNSFDFLGGYLNMNKLISFRSSIHDFVFNNGVQSNIVNSLAVKSPYVSGAEASKAINVLAYDVADEADFTKLQTTVKAKNLTIVNVSNDIEYDKQVGLVNEAIFIGNHTNFSIDKSVISGFKPAVVLDIKIKLNTENLDKIKFTSTYFNNCTGNIFLKNTANNDDLENWYGNRAFDNVYSKGPDSETFINSKSIKEPDYRLRINKIIASNN